MPELPHQLVCALHVSPQHQDQQPGLEYRMNPQPISECAKPSPKLTGWTALITGGDSGIGRVVAYAFVKEEAKVAIAYYDENRMPRRLLDTP